MLPKILMITSGTRPVPAVLGGATQTMMTHLIDVNEINKDFEFHIINPFCKEAIIESKKYNLSSFSFICSKSVDRYYSLFWRILRKISKGRISIKSNFIKRCRPFIEEFDPDIVLVEGNYFQCNQLREYIGNKKLLLHVHIDGVNRHLDLAEQIVRDCTGIITISDFCRNRVLEINGAKENQVRVLKNTIDIKHFSPVDRSVRISLRRSFNISDNSFVITYCGRLCFDKGVKHLLEAVKALSDSNVTLLIIGTPAYQGAGDDEFVKTLKEIAGNMVSKVIFTGYVNQDKLPAYYGASDLFVLPSICNEAAGNVIIEAFACGLPVISTKQGGIPEYANPKASILVDANDDLVSNLKEAITHIMTDSNLYHRLQFNARNCTLEYDKFSYYKNFSELIEYFNSL